MKQNKESDFDEIIFSPSYGDERSIRSQGTVPFGLPISETRGLIVTKINIYAVISNIKILSEKEVTEVVDSTKDTVSPTQEIVTLMNGEYITGVDMFSPPNGVGFTALCIHTNRRSINVFDDLTATLKTYKPPEGYYIRGIMGNTTTTLNKLIFKCLPIESFQKKINDKCSNIKKFDESGNTSATIEESSIATIVKAVILTYSDLQNPRISNIRVMSAYDFDQLKQTETKLKCRIREDKEILFVLMDDELIKRVDIMENRSGSTFKELVRVRFHTNHRQSPWYGSSDENEAQLTSKTNQMVNYNNGYNNNTFNDEGYYGYDDYRHQGKKKNQAKKNDKSDLGYKTFQESGAGYICGFYKTSEGFGCYKHNISIG